MKMKKPDVTSFSFEGVEYKADKKGAIDIPEEAVAAALELGLTPVESGKSE